MRLVVVGHVEWVQFVRVPRVPPAGTIVHAAGAFEDAAGGGPVAAVQLAKLAGGTTFLTALGDDEVGHRTLDRLRELGLDVHAAFRPEPQRRAIAFLDDDGERTITVIGSRLGPRADDALPWDALDGADGVYFTAGDAGALRHARRATALVATSRAREVLRSGVRLDVLIGSDADAGERFPEDLEPVPAAIVRTDGSRGGTYETAGGASGRFDAAPPPGPVADAYGCGDSFAGGLTYGLAAGDSLEAALALAARCGAACLTGHGPYEAQLETASG